MRKYVILVILSVLFLSACKKKQKCCCTNISIIYGVTIKDTSTTNDIDTSYIKANNQLLSFNYSDSMINMELEANIGETKDDEKFNTINLIKFSDVDIDTITTEINGTCGRTITAMWYNGELKYSAAFTTTGRTISILK